MAVASRFRLRLAANVIANGGIVAHPTEGVFGLACDPDNSQAILRLLHAKARDASKGLLLIASHWSQLQPYCAQPSDVARSRMRAAWPGPTTFIVDAVANLSPLISGGRPTVAVRVTAHPLSRALCSSANQALVSTSANLSGRATTHTALRVRCQLGNRADLVMAGNISNRSRPTAIVDARTGQVLRAG